MKQSTISKHRLSFLSVVPENKFEEEEGEEEETEEMEVNEETFSDIDDEQDRSLMMHSAANCRYQAENINLLYYVLCINPFSCS